MATSAQVKTQRKVPARQPVLDRPVAMALAALEYDRVLAALSCLTPGDWSRPTCCTGWDVRAMATHILGMAEMAGSLREQLRQMRKARRAGAVFIDALTGLQVAERTTLTASEVLDRLAEAGPRAARGRNRTPAFVRRRVVPMAQPVGARADSPTERWTVGYTVGYLVDVILTRDTWMHRTDIAAATGRPLTLTADHDGVLIADVAREWAIRHATPCSLTLTGPAGGSWSFGAAEPQLEYDAVQFCRALAGRGPAEGLLHTEVPF